MIEVYKICELDQGKIKTLFHGVNGSRELKLNEVYSTETKRVRDGSGTEYDSGFHFLLTLDSCKEYLDKFKSRDNKVIVKCHVSSIRPKQTKNSKAFLSNDIKLLDIVYP